MRLEVKACGMLALGHPKKFEAQCRLPKEAISIHETEIEVLLQALLNNTSDRLIKLQREVILRYMESDNSTEMEAVLLYSWGFDGSSGHCSEHKQNYESEKLDSNVSDANLFITSLIPLRLLKIRLLKIIIFYGIIKHLSRLDFIDLLSFKTLMNLNLLYSVRKRI